MKAPGYADLLRSNKSYRLLWTGQVISFFGDWFKSIALYTIVQEMTGSAQAIAGVLVALLLPIFLVMPIAGPLVDKFDRRKLLIFTDVARAICAPFLVLAHHLNSLPMLFGVLVLMVGFSGIFIPARSAVIPQITSKEELPVAMALSGGSWSVMLAVGAAAGGFVTAWLGADNALFLDGLTFLLSGVVLWFLPALPPQDPEEEQKPTTFLDGLRYLKRTPTLAAVLLVKPAIGLSNGIVVMLPIFGNGFFPNSAGPQFIGLLYAVRGLGALIGSMGFRKLTGDSPHSLRRWIAPGFLLSSSAYMALSFAPGLEWVAVCYLIGSIGTGVCWVFAGTLGQYQSAREYRGRVFSLEFGLMTLVGSAMSWLAGMLVDAHGWTPQMVSRMCSVVLIVPALLWWLSLMALKRSASTQSED